MSNVDIFALPTEAPHHSSEFGRLWPLHIAHIENGPLRSDPTLIGSWLLEAARLPDNPPYSPYSKLEIRRLPDGDRINFLRARKPDYTFRLVSLACARDTSLPDSRLILTEFQLLAGGDFVGREDERARHTGETAVHAFVDGRLETITHDHEFWVHHFAGVNL